MSIILIGMPSCGKSTLGVLLAKNSGLKFIDSDLLIQEREGVLLYELIREKGIDGFISVEESVNLSIEDRSAVISTGGSAVYSERAMKHLASLGTVVYLRISLETLKARLGDYVHRGVVMPEGYTLDRLYEERSALYERYGEVTVDVDNRDISTSLKELLTRLEQKTKK